jgi:sulfur carrier protein
VNVRVNGEEREVPDDSTVADVVSGPDGRGIAVAVNNEVVHRSQWPARRLREHDRIEILHAVGGG